MNDLERFLTLWDTEAANTASLLRALPADQYDFRPDPAGRSIGEMAWHLAEGEAYNSFGIVRGAFDATMRPPGIERPRTIAELAPGFERVHAEAKARLADLTPERLDQTVLFFDRNQWPIRDILWNGIVLHLVHHRGQLSLLCRQAGGVPPGMYGPNREAMAAMRAAAGA